MTIYTTYYQACKANNGTSNTGDNKIVAVSGGYAIMTWSEYNVWHTQR